MRLGHIALLVRSLEAAMARVAPHVAGFAPIETFAEGTRTREAYALPKDGSASLMLTQPHGSDGPYHRALARRGPGLHHISLHAPSVDAHLAGLAGSGWLMLPQSAKLLRSSCPAAYLARPGVGTLIELEQGEPASGEPLVTLVEVPMATRRADLLQRLAPDGVDGLAASPDARAWITVGGARLAADAIGA